MYAWWCACVQESWTLFTILYRSWCHNPVTTVALCLLTQNYEHASNLVQRFSNIEITASLLIEIDRLVQLIESPIFSFLRLQLLVPLDHAHLVKTLYGLLMVLPQSTAFNSLKQRLSWVSQKEVCREYAAEDGLCEKSVCVCGDYGKRKSTIPYIARLTHNSRHVCVCVCVCVHSFHGDLSYNLALGLDCSYVFVCAECRLNLSWAL